MSTTPEIIYNRRFEMWWKDLGLRKLIAWQLTILISQMTTGYDESVVGSMQSMKPWVKGQSSPSGFHVLNQQIQLLKYYF